MIPNDWNEMRLSKVITGMDAGISVNSEDKVIEENDYGILKTSAVTSGYFDVGEVKAIVIDEVVRAKVNPLSDTIIMSRMNTPALVGASAYVNETIDDYYLPDRLWRLSGDSKLVYMKWLAFVLGSPRYRAKLTSLATGTSNSMKNITKGDVKSLFINIPPLAEQKAIAELLSTWDEAIEKTEKLIKAKEKRFKVVLGLVFNEEYIRRSSKTKKVVIGSFLKESRIPGSNGLEAKKITVKLYGKGVVPKDEKRLGSKTTRYYKRKAGQFIYSKLDFLNGAFGIIPNLLNDFESTLDVPAFDVSKSVSKEWFLFYISRPEYYSKQIGLAKGQRKARRVNPSELLNSKILVPSLDKQNEIAEILLNFKHEISIHDEILKKYREQKLGLMQKLLTGEWRIKKSIIENYEEN